MVRRTFFCFQAEDGIRDLVRSRGLGDVYKRQAMVWIYMGLMGREFFVSRWLKAHPLIYMLSHMVLSLIHI